MGTDAAEGGVGGQADDKACEAPQGGSGAAWVGTESHNSYAGEGMVDALEAVTP